MDKEFFKEPQEFLNVGEEFPCGYPGKTRGFFVKTIGFFVKTIGFFVKTIGFFVSTMSRALLWGEDLQLLHFYLESALKVARRMFFTIL